MGIPKISTVKIQQQVKGKLKPTTVVEQADTYLHGNPGKRLNDAEKNCPGIWENNFTETTAEGKNAYKSGKTYSANAGFYDSRNSFGFYDVIDRHLSNPNQRLV